MAEQFARGGEAEQEDAGDDQRGAVEGGAARDVDVDLPVPVAGGGDGQQGGDHGGGHGAAADKAGRGLAEQHRIRRQHDVEHTQRAKADRGQVDVPFRVLGDVLVQVLDQQDGADGQAQPDGDAGREQGGAGGAGGIDQHGDRDDQQQHKAHHGEGLRALAAGAHGAAVEMQDEEVPGHQAQQVERAGEAGEGRLRLQRHAGRPGGGDGGGQGQQPAGVAGACAHQDQRREGGVDRRAAGMGQHDGRDHVAAIIRCAAIFCRSSVPRGPRPAAAGHGRGAA